MQIRRVQVAWCSHAHDTVENPFATAEPRRSGLVEASCNRQVTNRHSGVVNLAASREQGGAIFSKPYFETLPFMRYPPPRRIRIWKYRYPLGGRQDRLQNAMLA